MITYDRSTLEQIQEHFPEVKFSSHCSDLYLEYSTELNNFLKENLPESALKNMTYFTDNIDKKRWIELPFHYDEYFSKRFRGADKL